MTKATVTSRSADAREAAESPVLEIVDFRLADGVAEMDFIAAAKGTEAMLRQRGALVRRLLTRDADGLWTDVVEWVSHDGAMAAAEAVMTSESCQPFMAMIDPASVVMRHAPILWRMD